MPAGQKRAPDPITDGCEPPCSCWELNSGPLEEEAMLLTSEPSLQPPINVILKNKMALQIRALAALPEDLGLIPSTYIATHTCL